LSRDFFQIDVMLLIVETLGMNTKNQIELINRQREWVKDVMSQTGWTQTQLSRMAKLNPSTLSHFLNGKRDGHSLTSRTISAIEQATGLSFDGRQMPPAFPAGSPLNDGEALNGGLVDSQRRLVETLLGEVETRAAYVLKTDALATAGYLPGDILIVDSAVDAMDNDLVCALATDADDGSKRTIFRFYCQPYLVSPGTRRQDRFPMVVDRYHTKLRGVVVYSLRGRNTH
jgi:transcriptional regulator with XRE-family HTH domain